MAEVLAIVPARAGSKGLPGKNMARVGGRTLVDHAIAAGLASSACTRVVVSTDSADIAEEARRCGAEVPFMRPAELARDDTPGIAPVLHALSWLEGREGYRPDWVVLLQPTSPLRIAADVELAVALAIERQADSVVSVTPAAVHPYYTMVIEPDGRLRDFIRDKPTIVRRQDLPPAYCLNGAIYIARPRMLTERGSFFADATWAYVMPPERSIDVDSAWDLHLADLILSAAAREPSDPVRSASTTP